MSYEKPNTQFQVYRPSNVQGQQVEKDQQRNANTARNLQTLFSAGEQVVGSLLQRKLGLDAFSIASIANAILLFYQLVKEGLIEINRDGFVYLLRIALATTGMTAFLMAFNPDDSLWIDSGIFERIGSLFFLISLSVIIYFSILFLLGFRLKDLRIETTSQRL